MKKKFGTSACILLGLFKRLQESDFLPQIIDHDSILIKQNTNIGIKSMHLRSGICGTIDRHRRRSRENRISHTSSKTPAGAGTPDPRRCSASRHQPSAFDAQRMPLRITRKAK